MRRWFAMFLSILLLAHFSGAALAAYCGHETGVQAQHLVHHEHTHAGHADMDPGADPAGKDAPVGNELDCGCCHGSCCGMWAPLSSLPPKAIAAHPVTPVQGTLRTLAQIPPERPQWVRLA